VVFKSMNIKLGPEMRAVYPFVLNFKLSGEIELNGAADPAALQPSGTVMFESGEINLVATQVSPVATRRAEFGFESKG
jgi:hypothetical protein